MTHDKCDHKAEQNVGAGNAERELLPQAPPGTGPGVCSNSNCDISSVLANDDHGNSGREGALSDGTPAVKAPRNPDGDIIKPANDDMSYRHLVLPNGLRVLLISDPTTDKAGAAMDVRVGSLSDPDSLPGAAHFLEHMLFFSSEKYPEEDEYTKFISDRGGSTNAFTAAEHTNYHFDINWESLAPALDRFAQFFIAPTISQDGIEREVKAVDSEHGKNLQSDAWRKAQVNKATANRLHPWSRFSTGNYETLYTAPLAAGIDPRDAVLDFYNLQYTADRCSLAVLGRQPLEELEELVRSMFSAVPQKQLPQPSFRDDVYLPEHMGVLIKLVPVREGQSLELVWQVPPAERLFREQPLGYLSHLLGHEGEGSVFALLKSSGWASALWAGESGGSMSFASFLTVHIDLTDEGQRNIRDVATVVFRYLALLRREGSICERIWDEVRGLAQLQFDTRDRSKPITYCTTLADGLQLYPPQDLLPAVYGVPREFSPAAIREALELMTPQRVRALWTSKVHLSAADASGTAVSTAAAGDAANADANTGSTAAAVTGRTEGANADDGAEPAAGSSAAEELLTEPVYGTRYGISPLPADWLEAWAAAQPEDDSRLHLPTPNRFIPTDLTLVDDESAAAGPHPEVVVALPGRLRLWHKPDTRFRQPKAVLNLDVQSPEAYTSPRAAVMTRLFTRLMLDYLNEVAYPAQQAGLDYNLINTQSGWQLLLSGYNHKMPELLQEVLGRLADFKVLPDRFEVVREALVREYANQMHNQPYSWAMYRAEMLTTARRWPIEVYGSQASSVSADELRGFVKRLCSRCFVEGLAAGNLRRRQVLRCAALLLSCLRDRCSATPLHPAEAAELRVLHIPPTPTPAGAAAAPDGSGGGSGGGGGGGGEDPASGALQPVSGGWLFAEDVPSGQDENTAVLITYQVGPDTLRRNALRSLLVHLAKRDAFSELRTKQQLGYIVSLHGGSEHGVGYVEAVVQSNAYDADELCRRLDDFLQWFLDIGLPAKCGLDRASAAGAAAAEGAAAPSAPASISGTAAADSDAANAATAAVVPETEAEADGAANEPEPPPSSGPSSQEPPPPTPPPSQTEFEVAVGELAKSKLEKPKKLGELASRWWSEVQHGSYCFNRREAEVAELRSITPQELIDFAWEVFAGAGARPAAAEAARQETTASGAAAGALPCQTGAAASAGGGGGSELSSMLGQHCRRITVQVKGTAEAARASSKKSPPPPPPQQQQEEHHLAESAGASADGVGGSSGSAPAPASGSSRRRLPYHHISAEDAFSWKRSCTAFPSVRALWTARRRAAAGGAALAASVAAEEVELLVKELELGRVAGV